MPTNSSSSSGVAKASPIIFTQAASDKTKELITEKENPNLKLRAYVTGGGCSGFQYGFAFEEEQNEEDLDGSRFVVENPNATATCGCGSSFSI